jgi:hypothetical protein
MPNFDPRRDPPYYAVLSRTPPPGIDGGQFIDAGERMIGRAAAEPGFLGIEEVTAEDGTRYTVCYWDRPSALRRWRSELDEHVPPKIAVDSIVCFEGCFWHWLTDIFDAIARVDREKIVRPSFGSAAA